MPVLAADEGPAPMPLVQPVPPPSQAPAEETPGFQAVRPLPGAEAPAPVAPPAPVVAPAPMPPPLAPVAQPAPVAPAPTMSSPESGLPALLVQGGAAALMIAIGALVAGLVGNATAGAARRREEAIRRKSAAATLVIELEARIQAFEAVPVPPNADAGVSFVSALVALADLDYGWKAAQGALYLLPERLAGHLAVHYAAVHHVAKFIKGQSFAAGLRMLQANRIGGHPCPDAGIMREAHVELAAAFRGLDKIVMGLRSVS
ncbi:Ferric siderophore transport system periplasmic binding protein TonB [Paramagnetospirillum magnetotacticum MS-1]|uniref:Ferric siderophore transport system periplasmic binding protein TonB n=1 Tax=Paramagnetospirillum magnetotacticum MS-1 TaxID=272627 RepID=A0A0C2YXH9_PARME|nr:Ferric siderophore transport system periplasmic binding protein TonB [Paramagnetospirillum magnetotacticum MS-1]